MASSGRRAPAIWHQLLFILLALSVHQVIAGAKTNTRTFVKLSTPIVINTWNFTSANARAWKELSSNNSALDAIEFGTGQCEVDRCDGTVGWGGSPAETGETTLDAMVMDGETYDVGAVGGLRRIKGASSVARLVLERTNHTLLVGEMATQFAVELGFKEQSLESEESRAMHEAWLNNSCQPNYWRNVSPNPRTSCGPYTLAPMPILRPSRPYDSRHHYITEASLPARSKEDILTIGHDTIGMVAMDSLHRIAAGTSTNGLRFKILGRVGDSPVPGAGAYAAREAGAAAATGDGDVMMRFLLSYQAVENLRQGMDALEAARDVIRRQTRRTGHPYAHAAVIVLGRDGSFGAACCGYVKFPFVVSDSVAQHRTYEVDCEV